LGLTLANNIDLYKKFVYVDERNGLTPFTINSFTSMKETDSRGRTVAEGKAPGRRTVCGCTERRRPPGFGSIQN